MLELSPENAEAYLQSQGIDAAGASIRELGGGVSNTVLLIETGARRLVLKQSLGRLRVEQEWLSDRARIFRESEAMRRLFPLVPAGTVPEVLFEDRENFAFAMTAAPAGSCDWKSMLLAGHCDASVAATIGALLGRIVASTWKNPKWETAFGDQTVFDQLRLDPYYRSTAARHPDLASHFDQLIRSARERRVSLVHGDWSPKNFLVQGREVTSIDYEVVHFGDPSFDSAFLLNHLLLKSLYRPQDAPAYAMLARQFWEALSKLLPSEAVWFEESTIAHLGGLHLARADGKSPAEYIVDREPLRRRARKLILEPPARIGDIFEW